MEFTCYNCGRQWFAEPQFDAQTPEALCEECAAEPHCGVSDKAAGGSPAKRMKMELTLLSTVVAPAFAAGALYLAVVPPQDLPTALRLVSRNLCGHPVTDRVLRQICPALPAPERGFWDGHTPGLAVRPKGGVRGAQAQGDIDVTASELEAVRIIWQPYSP